MNKKIAVIIVMFPLLLCGCGTSSYVKSANANQFEMGKSTYASEYYVLQTLTPHFALASSSRLDAKVSIIAVKTPEESDPFYDGQRIVGSFVMVDTYTYETREHWMKTVPLVVPKKAYQAGFK